MFDSLAHLQTEVDQRLGHLDRKFLDPEDVTAAAVEALAFRGLQAAQSEYGRASKHVDFVPTSRDFAVNKASDMAVPSYLQIQISPLPTDRWEMVHTTHQSALSEIVGRRAAWYEDDKNKWRLALNYDPTGLTHRLWYYTDPVFAKVLTDPMGLPTRFGYLFLHDTILGVISTIVTRAAQLPSGEGLTIPQMKAIEIQAARSNTQVEHWAELWDAERKADKSPRGRNRRPVLGMMGRG